MSLRQLGEVYGYEAVIKKREEATRGCDNNNFDEATKLAAYAAEASGNFLATGAPMGSKEARTMRDPHVNPAH